MSKASARTVAVHARPAPHLEIAYAPFRTANLHPASPRPTSLHAALPEPEVQKAQAEPAEPMILVKHDRKQHFAADAMPTSEVAAEEPRKASAADFLTVDPVPVASLEEAPLVVVAPAAKRQDIKSQPSIGTALVARAKAVTSSETKPLPLLTMPLKPKQLVAAETPEPVIMAPLFSSSGRLIVPAALKGSHEILLHQNQVADSEGLDRIQDDEDLNRMRASKLLVALPIDTGLQVDDRLEFNRRYARPWVATFLTAISKAHYARFHTNLQVNSAVRTVEFQQRLMRTNGNAAPFEGETASPHLTGQAIDIAKHGLSLTEVAWMRGYLLPLVQQGKIDVEEEFQQACFHISVYKKYVPQPAPRRTITPDHGVRTGIAAAIP